MSIQWSESKELVLYVGQIEPEAADHDAQEDTMTEPEPATPPEVRKIMRRLDWQARIWAGFALGTITGVVIWLLVLLFVGAFFTPDYSVGNGVDPNHPVLDQASSASPSVPPFLPFFLPVFLAVGAWTIYNDYQQHKDD